MALMTSAWNWAGMPRWCSCAVRLDRSWEITSEPSTATPVTAPISRLVLAAEAAMPETLRRHRGQHRGGDRDDRRADADPGQRERGHQRAVIRMRGQVAVRQEQPAGQQQAADRDRPA